VDRVWKTHRCHMSSLGLAVSACVKVANHIGYHSIYVIAYDTIIVWATVACGRCTSLFCYQEALVRVGYMHQGLLTITCLPLLLLAASIHHGISLVTTHVYVDSWCPTPTHRDGPTYACHQADHTMASNVLAFWLPIPFQPIPFQPFACQSPDSHKNMSSCSPSHSHSHPQPKITHTIR